MRFTTTLTAVLVLALLGTVSATAFATDLEASADAYGMKGYYNELYNADVNFGTEAILPCKWDGSIWSRKAWTKFDLSSLTEKQKTATFEVVKTHSGTATELSVDVYALNDGDAGEDWGETTITYNNCPGNNLSTNDYDSTRTTYMGSIAYDIGDAVGTSYSFSTPELVAAVNADTDDQLSLFYVVTPNSGTGAHVAARENGTYDGPTLSLVKPAGLPVIADAHVESTSADTNFGSLDYAVSKSWGTGVRRKTYLKWDLSSVSGSVTTSTLQLQCAADSLSISGMSMDVYVLDDDDEDEGWGESTITWNNAPANVTTDNTFTAARTTYLGNIEATDPLTVGDFWRMSTSALSTAINADTDDSLTLMMCTHTEGPYGPVIATKEDVDGNATQNWNVPFIEPRLIMDETLDDLPAESSTDLSRGHEILLDIGLQLQAQVFDKPTGVANFEFDNWEDANFTTMNFQWDYDMAPDYLADGDCPANQKWGRWSQDTDLTEDEDDYVADFVSFQYEDEQDISVPATLATVAAGIKDLQDTYSDALVFTNFAGDQHSVDEMRCYMAAAQPDMLMFDTYIWNATPHDGGSPTQMYNNLERYRLMGLRGNDWSCNQPIPTGKYIQTFVLGEDEMSESELDLEYFTAWAFGYKFISAFVFNSPYDPMGSVVPYLFDDVGTDDKSSMFDEVAEANEESANIGPALVELISTDVRMIMGQHMDGETPTTNTTPDLIKAWDSDADPYITSIDVSNEGNKNDYLDGDVVIGYFKVLDEDFDGPTYEDEIYFMIVNGLTDPNGTGWATRQEITLHFDFLSSGITQLLKISRDDGDIDVVTLTSDGGSEYHVHLLLEGGNGDLFKFDTGADFVSDYEAVPEPSMLMSLAGLLVGFIVMRRRAIARGVQN